MPDPASNVPPEPPAFPGLPDAGALQEMANAFFRALPNGAGPASPAASPPPPPAMAGPGFAPPSAPAPATPVATHVVPTVSPPAPFATLSLTPDVNLGSIAEQSRSAEPGLYVAGFSAARPAFVPKPIPALDRSLPNEEELKALIAGPAPARGATLPTGGGTTPSLGQSSEPYFLKPLPEPRSGPRAVALGGGAAPAPAAKAMPGTGFDPRLVRREFPILSERVEGKPLVWLDNAATTQKPKAVIDRLVYFYEHENSNIHRAAHTLAARATDAYEAAREEVRSFLNAGSSDEVVFVRGATEAINLVAETWGRANIGPGDEILITWLEHHANIVPWHRLAKSVGATLKVAPVDDRGDVIVEAYAALLGPRTKLVSLTQVSNALGTVTPAALLVAMAHAAGAKVLVDGAQSVSHMPTDVVALDADWFVFSGHKVFGPTGIGVLWGKTAILAEMPPYQSGGNMIADVTFETIRYQPPPFLFEAGTGNIADAVGLGAALAWLSRLGLPAVAAHEHALIEDCVRQLKTVSGVKIVGDPRERAGVVSFVMDGLKTEEVGKRLARDGIAVRSGHHCAQPILRRFGLESSVRPSFAVYNTHDDIDALIGAVRRIRAGA
ncbi:cysteine desulfurase [Siculibacillus lacustris]|uniref:cysteine desulfurase n=1 Tax=Siculibacillus lacustris TaxID=1549641 RepID=A0A4V2KT33_9HYPH|nr:cysteine desulfurase [Siculibacillus lacustris]TBW35503.1 cysteine desulfurase [Siculibacillus lacustris]